jgi:tRNA-dihydrouridine synthase
MKFIRRHIGEHVLDDQDELKKTMVQILTSPIGKTEETISQLQDLGIHWLDLNIGCPSGNVVKHHGGSYWLKNLDALYILVRKIRSLHGNFFSIKMRIGFDSTENFLESVKCLEDLGVDAITVHGRTREQMYSEVANWDLIQQASENVKIPIIGNGDLWNRKDISKRFEQTSCHSLMIARGALKTPWLACYEFDLEKVERMKEISRYFSSLIEAWSSEDMDEKYICKKIKELSRYIFEDSVNGPQIKRSLLLAGSFTEQLRELEQLGCM